MANYLDRLPPKAKQLVSSARSAAARANQKQRENNSPTGVVMRESPLVIGAGFALGVADNMVGPTIPGIGMDTDLTATVVLATLGVALKDARLVRAANGTGACAARRLGAQYSASYVK